MFQQRPIWSLARRGTWPAAIRPVREAQPTGIDRRRPRRRGDDRLEAAENLAKVDAKGSISASAPVERALVLSSRRHGHRRKPHRRRRSGAVAVGIARGAAHLKIVRLGRPRSVRRERLALRSGRQGRDHSTCQRLAAWVSSLEWGLPIDLRCSGHAGAQWSGPKRNLIAGVSALPHGASFGFGPKRLTPAWLFRMKNATVRIREPPCARPSHSLPGSYELS